MWHQVPRNMYQNPRCCMMANNRNGSCADRAFDLCLYRCGGCGGTGCQNHVMLGAVVGKPNSVLCYGCNRKRGTPTGTVDRRWSCRCVWCGIAAVVLAVILLGVVRGGSCLASI